MKAKLLKKIRKNYRLIKEVKMNGSEVFYIEERRLFLFIPYWDVVDLWELFYLRLETEHNSHESVMDTFRKVIRSKYKAYSKAFKEANTIKYKQTL